MPALLIYKDMAESYSKDPERWAFMEGTGCAVARVALPYSLKQLSIWLSCGGMALGAHPP